MPGADPGSKPRWLGRLRRVREQAYAPVLEVGALGDIAAVVVLGAGWEPDADWPAGTRLNDSSVHRLMEDLRLLQGLPEARLVVTGASRRVGELPVARGYARAALRDGPASGSDRAAGGMRVAR